MTLAQIYGDLHNRQVTYILLTLPSAKNGEINIWKAQK